MRRLLLFVTISCLAVVGVALRAQESSRAKTVSASTPAPVVTGTAAARRPVTAHAPAPIINEASAKAFTTTVRPFLNEFCFGCHGNKGEAENGLNLQSFESAETLISQRNHWEDVIGMLRGSEMPPLEEEQPEEPRRQAVATWLEREFARIDRVTPPDPGRVTARRLNRTEYNNTIRDLLGVDMRPADDFPQDDAGYGFDNIADVLSLSPVLMEKYLSTADNVARVALFGPPTLKPTLTRLRSEGRRAGDARTFPLDYDVTGLSLPNAFHAVHRVPVDGEYPIRVFLGGVRPAHSDPISLSLWVDDREVRTIVHDQEKYGRFDLDRQDFGGQTAEFRVPLTAGEHRIAVAIPRIFEGLPARCTARTRRRGRTRRASSRRRPTATPERVAVLQKNFEAATAVLEKIPLNGVRVGNVEVGGPYSQPTAPSAASRAQVYVCGHLDGQHQPACTRRIITNFARRAFRRPVSAREIEPYVSLVKEAQQEEQSFEEGLAVGISALLVSPDFLFRIERDQPLGPTRHVASDYPARARGAHVVLPLGEHAGREPCAGRPMPGTLRNPVVLAAQVRRMLRDPAVERAGRELRRAVAAVPRARIGHPRSRALPRLRGLPPRSRCAGKRRCSSSTSSARTAASSTSSTAATPSSTNGWRKHYGIADVSGPEFRRVDLTGTPRGGVVTQGSVLTVSSYATRTSPVLRGKWILDNLLECAAARAAGRRPQPRRDEHRHVRVGADAARGAPQEPDLRVVPPAHGPARLRPGEF